MMMTTIVRIAACSEATLTPRKNAADHPISQVLRTRQQGAPGATSSRTGAERNAIAIDKPLIGKETAQVLPSVLALELSDPKPLGGPIAFTIESQGAAVVIRPVAPLAYSTAARVALTDVADVAGNQLTRCGPGELLDASVGCHDRPADRRGRAPRGTVCADRWQRREPRAQRGRRRDRRYLPAIHAQGRRA